MNHNEGLNLTRILEVRWCIQDPCLSNARQLSDVFFGKTTDKDLVAETSIMCRWNRD